MLKRAAVILILLILLTGCGHVSKEVVDAPEHEEETTVQSYGMPEFINSLRSISKILGKQISTQGTTISTKPFTINRNTAKNSLEALAVNDGYLYWKYETQVRTINGIEETIYNQYRYYDQNGIPFNYAYNPYTATENYSYLERYQDITSSVYESHFHEKIVFAPGTVYITTFPGANETYIVNGETLEITNRAITFNYGTNSGTGTFHTTYGNNFSGAFTLDIINNVNSANGTLYRNGKKAIRMNVNNDNLISTYFMISKATDYYYNELNTLTNDIIDQSYIEFRDSSIYTKTLTLKNHSFVTINTTAGNTPVLSSNGTNIVLISNCDHIFITGISFINTNKKNYLNINNTSYAVIDNNHFHKTASNKAGKFINIANVDHVTIRNNIFCDIDKKSTGIYIATKEIDANILFDNNSFDNLDKGIFFQIQTIYDPLVTVSNSLFTNNTTGIYRSKTGWNFNNINNTFNGNGTDIQ